MKIPGSITPFQPLHTPTTDSQSASARPSGSDPSARFGSVQTLHPANGAIGSSSVSLSKFRDPAALANRADSRQQGASNLKQQITKQFGSEIANKIFNGQSSGQPAGTLPHDHSEDRSVKIDI